MNKTNLKIGLFLLFCLMFDASFAWAGTVKMRLVIVNPSASKTQTKSLKSYLPKEVALKDVKDAGGLDLEYDDEKGSLYVFKDVELAPGETKVFEITLDDVWMIAEDKIDSVRARTERVLKKLEGKAQHKDAGLITNLIFGRLDDIARTQNDANVSKQQHIAYHRDNVKFMQAIQEDLERLEKILVAVGGPPSLDAIEKSDVNLKSPSSKTTWIIIFVILIFIAILGGAFYFTWQGQARITENIFTKEKDNSYSDFKKQKQP